MTYKTTIVTAEDGSKTVTDAESTLVSQVMDGVTLPFKAFSDSNVFVTEAYAGKVAIASAAVGVIAGEAWGQSRSKQGKAPLYKLGRA